jgi:hypothetical protein
MKQIGYNLTRSREVPVSGCRMLSWIFGGARKPEPGQRVIWSAPRGNYLTGTYRENGWHADADDLHPSPHRVDYEPSIWRPI